jgi:hypothetical protein
VNRAGRDGTKGETAIVSALLPYYPMAERRAKQGSKDRGDIGGVCPGVVIESKHCPKDYRITQWLNEADREAINDSAELAVVWFKIRGATDPLDWPVMMRGRYFIPLLLRLTTAYQSEHVLSDSQGDQPKLF